MSSLEKDSCFSLQTEITALKENKAAQKRQDELTPIAPAIVAETKAPELKKAPTSTAAAGKQNTRLLYCIYLD